MAEGGGWASGLPGRHQPGPPQEGQGAGRRRWQQQQPYHEQQQQQQQQQRDVFSVSSSSPEAAAAAAPVHRAALSFPAPGSGEQQKRRCPEWEAREEKGEPPLWRRWRRPTAMEAPEAGLWKKLRGHCLPLRRRRRRRRPGCPSLPRRPWRLLAAGLTCCTVLALYAASSPGLLQDHLPPLGGARGRPKDEDDEPPVTVLLWWEPFGRSRRLGDCRRRFNVSACRLTTDRGRLLEAQAVLFHHRDLVLHGTGQLPQVRAPAQRWVWMNFESPSHSQGLRELGGVFNWTMSYRVDSDVFVPYGYLRPSRAPSTHLLALPKKTKLVAWVISNWNEDHARVRYYHQLKNYLPIDVYGAQGLELKDDSVVQTVSEYKFYLAFENSQHPDYITEKLWRNAFKSWAVPIVLGPPRSNYELFIPSDSFIHVDDFSDPMQLAVYLKYLDKNKSRYRRYFAWRKHYDVQVTSFWDEHCCRVCNVVRTLGKQRKTIRNLANWFES